MESMRLQTAACGNCCSRSCLHLECRRICQQKRRKQSANQRLRVFSIVTASDRVQAAMYGRTHEGRSLHYLTISSPDKKGST